MNTQSADFQWIFLCLEQRFGIVGRIEKLSQIIWRLHFPMIPCRIFWMCVHTRNGTVGTHTQPLIAFNRRRIVSYHFSSPFKPSGYFKHIIIIIEHDAMSYERSLPCTRWFGCQGVCVCVSLVLCFCGEALVAKVNVVRPIATPAIWNMFETNSPTYHPKIQFSFAAHRDQQPG